MLHQHCGNGATVTRHPSFIHTGKDVSLLFRVMAAFREVPNQFYHFLKLLRVPSHRRVLLRFSMTSFSLEEIRFCPPAYNFWQYLALAMVLYFCLETVSHDKNAEIRDMVTFLSIIGTRPEAIKMAAVLAEIKKRPEAFRSIVCVTGQHRELLDQVLTLFDIEADYDLNVMQPDQALSQLTADLLTGLDRVVEETKPEWILAQGDTTTALAAALVAHYRKREFAHVEAGLRSGEKLQPFPEEMNRRFADALADLLFAPTERSREALLREGIASEDIYVTGNTVVDALHSVLPRVADERCGPLADLPRERRVVLVTAHRRESLGDTLREICLAIRDLAAMFESEGIEFVYPVHPNPNVRRPVREILSGLPNVRVIEPLDYLSMICLMKRCSLILTDSGGIQEEAPTLGIPVLVMREVTDRPEGLKAGVARLVGIRRSGIVEEAARLLRDAESLQLLRPGVNPYGDGNAASRIVRILIERCAG